MTKERTILGSLEDLEGDADVSLAEQAFHRIEELIVTLRLAPGKLLSEAALSKRLDIGRTPIREALQRLAREGLVVILPRRGITVSEINVKSQLDLLLVRRELERVMARHAAERTTAAERTAFADLAQAIDRAIEEDDDIEFMRLDHMLNSMVSLTCRNEYARRAMEPMHALSRRFWYMHYKETFDLPECGRLHADIARAIAGGSPRAAAAASDALVDYVETFTLASLQTTLPSGRTVLSAERPDR